MKILRLGFTEGTLLFIFWLMNYSGIKLKKTDIDRINVIKNEFKSWLHSTSGFYDNEVEGNYFNFIFTEDDTPTYNKYMEKIMNSIKGANQLSLLIHSDRFDDRIKPIINTFHHHLEVEKISINKDISQETIYEFIKDKRILIVSSFAELVKKQILSGNVKKIYNDFPNVKEIIAYTTPYTFFNKGPANNILETSNEICEEINKFRDEFDCAIISFGAYGCLVATHIHDELGKDVSMLGGNIQPFFGIANNRCDKNTLPNKEFWIVDVPDEYKPLNYQLIENGTYW